MLITCVFVRIVDDVVVGYAKNVRVYHHIQVIFPRLKTHKCISSLQSEHKYKSDA